MNQIKKCSRCQEDKDVSEFHRNKARGDGLDNNCKVCSKAMRRKRLSTDEGKRKHREQAAKWRAENPERHNAYAKKWRDANPDKVREKRRKDRGKMREYQRERRRNEPAYRLRHNVSRQVSHALFRSEGSKKGQSVMKHMPYTIQDLREHLESQFDDKMTWDNYGSYWHLDHIYPHSLLPYESLECENFQKAWSLDNLQPLEAIANIRKGARVE